MSDKTALDQFVAELKVFLPDIQERYSIDTLGVFGSFVRGEQTSDSDVDLVVTFQTPQSLLDLVELENLLSDHLGVKVDLVTEAGLKPRVREQMLKEVIYIMGSGAG
jgi:predicted nucleotidyltransferase